MGTTFKIGDKVKGNVITEGEVWKISDYGIHVRERTTERERSMFGNLGEYSFMVFYFNPTHHTQIPVSELKLYNQSGESL